MSLKISGLVASNFSDAELIVTVRLLCLSTKQFHECSPLHLTPISFKVRDIIARLISLTRHGSNFYLRKLYFVDDYVLVLKQHVRFLT